ncbi:hypothetical protein GC194_10725 [bacterium]|nr:hypothetical protein [bacterium]
MKCFKINEFLGGKKWVFYGLFIFSLSACHKERYDSTIIKIVADAPHLEQARFEVVKHKDRNKRTSFTDTGAVPYFSSDIRATDTAATIFIDWRGYSFKGAQAHKSRFVFRLISLGDTFISKSFRIGSLDSFLTKPFGLTGAKSYKWYPLKDGPARKNLIKDEAACLNGMFSKDDDNWNFQDGNFIATYTIDLPDHSTSGVLVTGTYNIEKKNTLSLRYESYEVNGATQPVPENTEYLTYQCGPYGIYLNGQFYNRK